MARRNKPIPGSPRAMAHEYGLSRWPPKDQDLSRFDGAPLRWALTIYASTFWRLQVRNRQTRNRHGRVFVSDFAVLTNIAVRFRTTITSVQDTINGDRWVVISDVDAFLSDPETAAGMRAALETRNLTHWGELGAAARVTSSAERLRREIIGSVKQAPLDEEQRRNALERLRVAVRSLVGVAADIEYSLQDDEHPTGDAYWMDLNHLLADGSVLPVTLTEDIPQDTRITTLVRYVLGDGPTTNTDVRRALDRIRPGYTAADVGQALRRLALQGEAEHLGFGKWRKLPKKKENG